MQLLRLPAQKGGFFSGKKGGENMTTREACSKSVAHPEHRDTADRNVQAVVARRKGVVPTVPEPGDPGFVSPSTGKPVSRAEGLSVLTV